MNDSQAVIMGTLAILIGSGLALNSGPPTNTLLLISYWSGVFLIVAGIFVNSAVVYRTHNRIEYEKLESIIRDLENQIRIKQLEIRVKELEEKD